MKPLRILVFVYLLAVVFAGLITLPGIYRIPIISTIGLKAEYLLAKVGILAGLKLFNTTDSSLWLRTAHCLEVIADGRQVFESSEICKGNSRFWSIPPMTHHHMRYLEDAFHYRNITKGNHKIGKTYVQALANYYCKKTGSSNSVKIKSYENLQHYDSKETREFLRGHFEWDCQSKTFDRYEWTEEYPDS